MIKLNDDNIFVGQIKQVLHTFNLPTCDIGAKNKQPNKHYIEGNSIMLYSVKEGVSTDIVSDSYIYGKFYANLTSKLKLNNNIYDRDTHRYLGKYLRFIRDYHGLNLMSMYNIFDSEQLTDSLYIKIKDATGGSDAKYAIFNNESSNTICYQMPITKSVYTIYAKSSMPVEIMVTLNGVLSKDKDKTEILNKASYKRFKIRKPVTVNVGSIIDEIIKTDTTGFESLYDNYKSSLCLLIKVSKSTSDSIVVLEGDYTSDYNNTTGFLYYNKNENNTNYITETEHIEEYGMDVTYKKEVKSNITVDDMRYSAYYTKPQLLSLHNDKNYLLSDKLIEYLTNSAISKSSEYYDIRKIQYFLKDNGYIPFEDYGIWGNADSVSIMKYCGDKKLYNNYDIIDAVDSVVETSMSKHNALQNKEGII